MWTHRDYVTDVFSFADLCDVHEMLDVKASNEKAVQAYMEAKRSA